MARTVAVIVGGRGDLSIWVGSARSAASAAASRPRPASGIHVQPSSAVSPPPLAPCLPAPGSGPSRLAAAGPRSRIVEQRGGGANSPQNRLVHRDAVHPPDGRGELSASAVRVGAGQYPQSPRVGTAYRAMVGARRRLAVFQRRRTRGTSRRRSRLPAWWTPSLRPPAPPRPAPGGRRRLLRDRDERRERRRTAARVGERPPSLLRAVSRSSGPTSPSAAARRGLAPSHLAGGDAAEAAETSRRAWSSGSGLSSAARSSVKAAAAVPPRRWAWSRSPRGATLRSRRDAGPRRQMPGAPVRLVGQRRREPAMRGRRSEKGAEGRPPSGSGGADRAGLIDRDQPQPLGRRQRLGVASSTPPAAALRSGASATAATSSAVRGRFGQCVERGGDGGRERVARRQRPGCPPTRADLRRSPLPTDQRHRISRRAMTWLRRGRGAGGPLVEQRARSGPVSGWKRSSATRVIKAGGGAAPPRRAAGRPVWRPAGRRRRPARRGTAVDRVGVVDGRQHRSGFGDVG